MILPHDANYANYCSNNLTVLDKLHYYCSCHELYRTLNFSLFDSNLLNLK